MRRVEGCQVLVVMVAHRYGWEPPDQPLPEDEAPKSITWLECEHATQKGAKVLAFLVDDNAGWPAELKEDYEVTRALQAHGVDAEFNRIAQETARRTQRLEAFKAWLRERGIRATFTDPGDLGQAVERALSAWKAEHLEPPAEGRPAARRQPSSCHRRRISPG